MSQPYFSNDVLRQSIVLAAAIANPVASQLPYLTGVGRTIAEQSEDVDVALVPWGPGFAIWGVIFIGLLGYAILGFTPANRRRPIFRESGWCLALAMGLSAIWALAASYTPPPLSSWLTALIFTPYTVAACVAMWVLTRHGGARGERLPAIERWLVWFPGCLFAGWVSLAVFINWEQVLSDVLNLPQTPVAVAMLVCAVAWIGWNLRRAGPNLAYVAAPVWGLALLVIGRLIEEPRSVTIAALALIGIAAVVALTLAERRRAALI